MNWLIILAVIAAAPVLFGLLFRVSAIYLFVSVAAGSLLVAYVGDDAALALSMFFRGANTNMIAQFVLQLAPVVFTILLLKKTMPSSKLLLHLFPLVAAGLALAVLTLPFIDISSQQQIFNNQYANTLKGMQDLIVASAALSVLMLTWLTSRHKEGKKKKSKLL